MHIAEVAICRNKQVVHDYEGEQRAVEDIM